MQFSSKDRLIVAADTNDEDKDISLLHDLSSSVSWIKTGLRAISGGYDQRVIKEAKKLGYSVFYDGKIFDIPATIGDTSRNLSSRGLEIFNISILCGSGSVRAAARNKGKSIVLGVTLLTSLGHESLEELELLEPIPLNVEGEVREYFELEDIKRLAVRLAKIGKKNGLDGIVASPHEIEAIRDACGDDFLIVTPGIRPTWASNNDQKRHMTPREAMEAGADKVVVGRPIISPPKKIGSSKNATELVLEEIEG